MIFATERAISQIIAGKKTCTRRLVKEGEFLCLDKIEPAPIDALGIDKKGIYMNVVAKKASVRTKKDKIKWQMGRSYAVQSGRCKPSELFCSKCHTQVFLAKGAPGMGMDVKYLCKCGGGDWTWGYDDKNYRHWLNKAKKYGLKTWKPLRIKIAGIRKERLLDISPQDIKKEGFNDRNEFLQAFTRINQSVYKDFKKPENINREWFGPDVWVLDFKIAGDDKP